MKKIFLGIACAFLFACGGEEVKVQKFERPIKTIEVESLSHLCRTFTGKVSSQQESNIGFKMGGEIVTMLVEDGQRVKKGELIAAVDNHDYLLQFNAAEASFKNDKSRLERYERLFAKEAISKQEYEMAQTSYANNKANYENTKKLLADTKLYAPFSGIVEKRLAEKFQRVQPSAPVVRLINPEILEIDFTLPVTSLPQLKNSDVEFRVSFENYSQKKFDAKIKKMVNSSPDGSGIPITLVVNDKNFDYNKFDIKSGFSCEVEMTIDTQNPNVGVVVPLSSVLRNDTSGKNIVWVYDSATSTVNEREIVLGSLYGSDKVIVESGVKQGEIIVSAGVHQVNNGQKVVLVK